MLGKTHADRHVADGVLKNQVPSDNPGGEFAHRGIGVGIGTAGNRNHGRKLGVADGGESAGDGHENKREGDRRPCSWTAERGRMVDDILEKWSVQN